MLPKCTVYFDFRKVKAKLLQPRCARGRLIGRIISSTSGESTRSDAADASGHALAIVAHGSKYNCGGDNCRNSCNCVTEMCGDISLGDVISFGRVVTRCISFNLEQQGLDAMQIYE
ncbi:hypothetical protein CDAR_529091 [Caerostris darwini]|uniref:Uncharacterized protein n=1 Tax=Caerostris darwini TaxID=1538125 RepID=A0AAV4UDW4_9ARAC|nr:hypothetical protein CDAR_529091 [Caerostris darwini]